MFGFGKNGLFRQGAYKPPFLLIIRAASECPSEHNANKCKTMHIAYKEKTRFLHVRFCTCLGTIFLHTFLGIGPQKLLVHI
jgi:hypothetical protein